jgi:hypothetical protein
METDPRPRGAARLAARWHAAPRVLRARRAARAAGREEREALLALGDALAAAPGPVPGALAAPWEAVAALDARRDALRGASEASLAEDRADFEAVAAWARPLVVARGLAARAVVRHRLRRVRRDRAEACVRLGVAALGTPRDLPGRAAALADVARDARERGAAAAREAESLLAPLGGGLLPGPVRVAAREARAFCRAVVREARAQLVPRVPALFGLAAGWAFASTFTDSRLAAAIHSLGIVRGPRVAVDGSTYQVLRVALPILAAAACSYASARLAALVRARYAGAEARRPPGASRPPAGALPPGGA